MIAYFIPLKLSTYIILNNDYRKIEYNKINHDIKRQTTILFFNGQKIIKL